MPFPRISSEGELIPGSAMAHPVECARCAHRPCAQAGDGLRGQDLLFTTCYRGLTVSVLQISDRRVVVNGILLPEHAAELSRKQKHRLASQVVRKEALVEWRERAMAAATAVQAAGDSRVEDTLGMLHDVQTVVSSLLRNAEDFVQQQPGASFDAKLETLSPAAVSVVKSVQLLQARMLLLPLLTNPDAARYGQRHPTPVYRLVDRIVRIMKLVATRGHISLHLVGSSFNTPDAFDSFETIPLVLIDNAIKYSRQNQSVEVTVTDVPRGVSVGVSSFSPLIPEHQRQHLFDRGFRGDNAAAVASHGSGLGLYLAQLVAEAHGTRIVHSCDGGGGMTIGGVAYCNNTFSLRITG